MDLLAASGPIASIGSAHWSGRGIKAQ
jgi:hypothetical protein